MATISPTECCAIGLLRATNDDTVETILEQVQKVIEEQKKSWLGTKPGQGQTLLLAVTTPFEAPLGKMLYAAGFNVLMYDIPRRMGYPAGDLILWSLRIR